MANTLITSSWRGVALTTNGEVIKVSTYNITPADLTDLLYAALEEIPAALIAMDLAMEKYRKNHNHE